MDRLIIALAGAGLITGAAAPALGAPPPGANLPPGATPEAPRALGGPAGAEGPADRDEAEDQAPVSAIVVTARRLDAARTRVDQALGASVYELHNEAIENRPGGETGAIGAILTQTPGVALSSSGPQIRGSSAVQVRINGALLPEAISDPADRLSSRLAQTTRVITGALPARFGFAPGGVIAVTTKNGLYQHGGQAEFFAGSRGAFEPAFEWGGSAARSSLFASGSLEGGRSRVAGVSGPWADSVRREIGGLAFADHVIDDHNRVSLIVGGSRERRRIGRTDLPAGTERTSDGYAVGTYQHSAHGFTWQGSLFAGGATRAADFLALERERRSSFGLQMDASLRAGGANRAGGGLLLSRAAVRDPGAAGGRSARRTSLGIYVQDEWTPGDRLTINAGVRGDWLRRLGSEPALQPRASLVWTPGAGFTAHAGYARYASAPPLGEARPGVRLPDERDDYVDVGAQQALGPVTLGVDLYRRWARNLIEERAPYGRASAQAFAFARGRFAGVELSATYVRGPVTAWANASLSKSQGLGVLAGDGLFPAATLAGARGRWTDLASDRPITASGGVTWRVGDLDLAGDLLAGSGAVRTLSPSAPNAARGAAFVTAGVTAVYHARAFGKPIDLRLDLTNLADARYLTNDAGDLEGGWSSFAPGRALLVGFEQSF
ncbi:MAG: TonB-dependent receptor [Alphaproteobacteria bacterium]|nr:TonB-dependent receptor [Alphaproteobacteria bacterium]